MLLSSAFGQDKPDLTFSPIGGVYEKETLVTLNATEGSTIYYTLDGSSPGSGSSRYRKEIKVSSVSVIRAVAYLNGKRSDVVTNTYVCDREYDLAVISIATNPDNLWDYEHGIYVEGCCADTIEPYVGANFWKDWEKRANIEMYDEAGELCFNQQVAINLFGGFSRMLPQKSLAIFARKKYGNKRIKYQVFPERKSKKYKSIILRNSGGDFLRTHLRDAFMTQLAKPSGVAIQEYRPAVVFLNGKYWGIQNIREKISEHYLAANFGVDKEKVDILRHNGVKRHGYSTDYKKLLAFLRNNDLSDDVKMDELSEFMDIKDYIRYNIAEVYSDNRDAGGNIRYWKERKEGAKWRWVFYDLDLGLGNNKPSGYKRNTLKKFTSANFEAWPDPSWSTFIIRSLLKNKKVETKYINTFADQLNTIYHPDTANRLLDQMKNNIDSEMHFHQKRWGSSYENWEHQISILRKFITLRPCYLRQHIMEKFEISDTINVKIIHPGTDICDIKFNTLKIKKDFSGIYFKDIPIKIKVAPKHDYEFVGWKNRDEIDNKLKFSPQGDIVLEPIIRPRQKSEYADSVIINEISFFQAEKDSSKDWIELYNNSLETIDVSDWGITKSKFRKRYKIPEGTVIEPGKFLILVQKKKKFKSIYSFDSTQYVGSFKFGLSKKGEHLKLYDIEGFVVDSLTYVIGEKDEWPDTSFTLALIHPDSNRYSKTAWNNESPSPNSSNKAYVDYLQNEADKAYWTKVFYFGGGGFFFISVVGWLFFRYSKKKKKMKE